MGKDPKKNGYMRIIVDTNIVFSAILNTDSKIARILLQPRSNLNFYSTEQLLIEINDHTDKLKKLSKYSDYELRRVIHVFMQRIRCINATLIPKTTFLKVLGLTSDIDIDDTEFVALTEHIKGKLWSGDKKLITGLVNKKWNKFISTEELYKLVSLNKK